ncbi:MAG: hypothetical protein L6Q54_06275 [Leptospiraceae bacterium]|nr:hypothetical protein [Leptospiraceae bacterium]MCK6380842.1 hypothetical protein [Leptospiraceae bacterium]
MNSIFLHNNQTKENNQELSGSLYEQNSDPFLATGTVGVLSPLLSKLVIREYNSTHALAKKHSIARETISRVLHGRKKSKRVEEIIRKEWGISIAEFQAVTRDWLDRKARGLYYTEEEIKSFADQVRARKMGKSVEELQEIRNQIFGGII